MSYTSARRTDWETRLLRIFRVQPPRPQRLIQLVLLVAFCLVIALTARPAGMPKPGSAVTPVQTLQLDDTCSPFGVLALCVNAPPA